MSKYITVSPQYQAGFALAMIREARASDEGFFYTLRKLAEDAPWYEGERVTKESHAEWFAARLDNPLVELLVWEEDGVPLGVVRVDSNGEFAFDMLIGCNGAHMLKAFFWLKPRGRLKVTLDEGDDQKVGLLERAGFRRFPATFLCYRP